MEQTKYRIGVVADLMGISRDTLRYYEKRGILPSEKSDNGYRYYTDQDVSRMISILYQRKMDIGLNDIENLWTNDSSIHNLARIIDQRLEEEELELRRHQQTIARLHMTRSDCNNILNHLNEMMLKDFPHAYVIVPHVEFQESIPQWFRYSKEYPGLDMMYLFDEYSWDEKEDTLSIAYRNTQMILGSDASEYVDYPLPSGAMAMTNPAPCVSTFLVSAERTPRPEDLRPMISWAREQGLMVSRQLFCTFALQGINDGKQTYYLQMYLPVF